MTIRTLRRGAVAVKRSQQQAGCPTALRDPATFPYAGTSPWNTPIGSGAQYMVSDAPNYPTSSANINTTSYSQPVYVAVVSDPTVPVYDTNNGNALYGYFQIPVGAQPSGGTDAHMNVVDPTHHTVVSMYAVTRSGNGDTYSWAPQTNDLRGDGLSGGRRAYGGSQIAGLIRPGEITTGIYHALAITADAPSMNKTPPYVWPATSADWDYNTSYGSTGHLHMGSLIAIPKSVNLASFGFPPAKLAIAKALQDYGAYVVDAGTVIALFVDPAAVGDLPSGWAWWNDGPTVTGLLQIVTNNTSSSVGGGGTPLGCIATAFLPQYA